MKARPPYTLCFDIGNTDIHGGVFAGEALQLEFRKSNRMRPTTDEFGVFMLQLLQAKGIEPDAINRVAIASVVPDSLPAVREACEKYLGCEPLVLRAGVRTGLKIRMKEPREVGADRIANAIAAVDLHPDKNLIVIDMGTATTICAVNAQREYLGGAIVAGLGLSMRALGTQTAKLPHVDIVTMSNALGKSTVENIQSGLYFGHLGMLKEMIARLREEAFGGAPVTVVGTGGFVHLFAGSGIFDYSVSALVLRGLHRALELNESTISTSEPQSS